MGLIYQFHILCLRFLFLRLRSLINCLEQFIHFIRYLILIRYGKHLLKVSFNCFIICILSVSQSTSSNIWLQKYHHLSSLNFFLVNFSHTLVCLLQFYSFFLWVFLYLALFLFLLNFFLNLLFQILFDQFVYFAWSCFSETLNRLISTLSDRTSTCLSVCF